METRTLDGVGPVPLDVAYQDAGDGPPLILLHGIPAWSLLWGDVVAMLADDCRVIALDLLGYGHSDVRDCFDRSVRRQARMVTRLMDALGLSDATVVGHDIGGAVAQVLAVDHADRVARLGLVDSVAYGSWPSASMAALGDPTILDRPEEITDILRRDLQKGHGPSADTEAFAEDMMAPYDTPDARLSLVRDACALNTNHTMELAGRLGEVDVPALVLWAEDDPWQPLDDAHRLADDLPDATLHTVPDAAHWLPYNRPAHVAEPLRSFVVG